ncbi:hypothetical protein P3X46_020652 [Hevea brasiliensis]|uniref:DUF506 domain-containing protein n=1 Tax=Hevea brasiliensis TaxID=3981 RepID=A0ABQ9LRH3_HEVBR|nr:uncharacterized protein LOC110672816 [Hevea brasiliensis]KAJ9169191.1 hypothetical protein P3X46_020652 [Hevea brasiliensis]
MAKRPMRFNNTRAAFDEAAQMRLCESSGSEHYSPDNSADLSELVNSFIERDYRIQGDNAKDHDLEHDSKLEQLESFCSDSEDKNILENLLNDNDDDDAKRKIRAETQLACGIVGERSSHGFKRRLMSRLREQGFDAGLCKSRWEKFGRHPPGEYEYVDVNIDGNRFVVEVFLAGEFEIARPTTGYAALLDAFPLVFIGKPEELKQVVRLMCSAIRRSMKEMDLHVPPWRRNGYIQAKWFGPYKRTINEIPVSKRLEPSDSFAAKRSVGFEAYPVKAYHCSDDFARDKMGFKVGYLTAAFNGSG